MELSPIWVAVKVFYMYEGELVNEDVAISEIGTLSMTGEGRLVYIEGDPEGRSYALFIIKNGKLIKSFTIIHHTPHSVNDDGDFYVDNSYAYYDGGLYTADGSWNRPTAITEEEYDAILIRYRLSSIRSLWGVADDMEQILALGFRLGC
jgi:hypothetical protein